ncbi:hypothetical protein B0I37DRAFT_303166 [Chaetomium sp. MPI-CAGE-AT-0009]|nr:hypothetical protein B0I37DRAFT_303166 [Chaetomium sp. MPI-CAGE-AT-0009]
MTSLVRRVRQPAPAGFERPSAESQKCKIEAEDHPLAKSSPSSRAVSVRKRRRRTFASLPPEIHLLIAEHLIYPDALSLKHTNRYFYSVVDTGVELKVEWLMERRLLHLECPSDQRCDLGSDLRFCRGSVKIPTTRQKLTYRNKRGLRNFSTNAIHQPTTLPTRPSPTLIPPGDPNYKFPTMRPGNHDTSLMSLPTEVLCMIAEWAATPFDESTPLDQHHNSTTKALSLVNRKLRDICLKVSFYRVRMWKREVNLADHFRNIRLEGQQILHLFKAIGRRPGARIGRRVRLPSEEDFFRNLDLLLSDMPNLTDIRLRLFPIVKSLYVRTASPMNSMFRCFPNLEAINFNIHGDTGQGPLYRLSREFSVLKEGFPRLKAMSIFKTTTRGWSVADIQAVVRQFPGIERLFLEGCIGTDIVAKDINSQDIARLFAPLRNLRHLALTDELYIPVTKNYLCVRKMDPLDPSVRWHQMATPFFTAMPNLRELCIGRQVDFRALVFRPNPAGGESPEGPHAQNQVELRVIRSYSDPPNKRRHNFPPACWDGKRRIWWPASGRVPNDTDMAVPDEPQGAVRFIDFLPEDEEMPSETSVHYQEMLLDHCEVSFWDAEWLRVIR